MNSPRDVVSEYLERNPPLPFGTGSIPPISAPALSAVAGTRNTALYTAHSYHTKVPPEAIRPFIEYFTAPGDVVLDPFCGSGMTGVAACMAGRNAVLNDLSPAAVHLSWNHTNMCDPDDLGSAFNQLEKQIAPHFQEMYGTVDETGVRGIVHWTMWSTRHRCTECGCAFALWDVVDRSSGRVGNSVDCPDCGTSLLRKNLKAIDTVPVWISYKTVDGKRRERAVNGEDIERAHAFSRDEIKHWFPTVGLGPEREMYVRCALHLKGIKEIADFYTPRNLRALSLIWAAIAGVQNDRVRAALTFAFTNTAWHGTRMRRFNARGGQRPLTGTLYIPQLSSEVNVLEVMRNKIQQLKRYYREFKAKSGVPFISNMSATSLSHLMNGSIDYIFTDPPFGSNLFYADCNLIWEAWLGRITDPTDEAVVNCSLDPSLGGKTLATYEGLMTMSLLEMARVLKPGGWATVVFHNTDGGVWKAIQNAAQRAGFEFHEASSLDRQQQSHKGYKGRSGEENVAHFDVVMNLRKPLVPSTRSEAKTIGIQTELTDLIRSVLSDPAIRAKGMQGVHAETIRRVVSRGEGVNFDFSDVRKIAEYLQTETTANAS